MSSEIKLNIKNDLMQLQNSVKPYKSKIKDKDKELYNVLYNIYNISDNKKFPKTIKDLVSREPVILQIYELEKDNEETIMKMKEYIEDIVIKDFYIYLQNYVKKNRVYPFLKDKYIKDFCKTYDISKIELLKIYNQYFKSEVYKGKSISSAKMRQLFYHSYIQNKELFEKFFIGNILTEQGEKTKDFQKLGKEIKSIIDTMEENLLKQMENGQYSDMSVSTSKKFNEYIQSHFSQYSKVGVKVRKLSKAEMKKYIESQKK